MIHIKLILVKGVRLYLELFFPCGCLVIPAPFVEKTVFFLPCIAFAPPGDGVRDGPIWSPAPFPFPKDLQTPDGGAS